MRVRRDVSAIPFRSASETWQQIVDLITGPGSQDAQQLTAATGVMCSIIADEHPARRPILVEGVGAQLRVYCRYGMKAMEEEAAVDPLTWNPTAGDWVMHVPCDAENIGWVKDALAAVSPRIVVFDIAESERADDDEAVAKNENHELTIDWNIRS